VVSVSVPVEGSPPADVLGRVHRRVFSRMQLKGCTFGAGRVIDSLRRSEQTAGLASHQLPKHVQYFSPTGYARPEDVTPLMLFTDDALAAAGERIDGYVPSPTS
jgi:hypothetical protein